MMSKPFLVIVFFIFNSIFVGNFFWSEFGLGQKDLCRKKNWDKKKFGSEIFLGQKNVGRKLFWVKKNLVQNFFWVKNLGQKKFWVKKFLFGLI